MKRNILFEHKEVVVTCEELGRCQGILKITNP